MQQTPAQPNRLQEARKYLSGLMCAFAEREVPMRGVALAYYGFFTLFPLVILALSVLGHLTNIGAPFARDLRASLVQQVSATVPGGGGTVSDTFKSLGDNATPLGIVGLVGLIWGLTGSLSAVGSALSRIFDPKAPFPTWRDRIKTGLVLFGIGGVFLILNLLSTILPVVVAALELPIPTFLIQFPIQVLGPVLAFTLLYRLLPTVPPSWRNALIGGAVGGLLFAIMQLLFSVYLRFVSFNGTFGSVLAGAAVLLVWLNFSATTFLLGALVAARLRPEDKHLQGESEQKANQQRAGIGV
ncbi:MAG TPA: YihY/virulence factor BrkB family protein [Deinococcales bacterium]|nr:YihY/virulence factor BrkB family protein [Deinococcales bacterium]